jgi:uroporphyrinogen decarboxylase
MENFMVALHADPDLPVALMETIADMHIEDFPHYVEALDPYLDIICVADDLGSQQGPQIDPKMWRRLVKPSMAKLYRFMKSRMKHAKLFLHSCGSVYDIIPDLIEMGVGTPAEVKDEVRRRIDDLAPGGGFIFAQVHNIQPDVPPQNMVAMWQTAARDSVTL